MTDTSSNANRFPTRVGGDYRPKRNGGFTLIELLVVVALVSILSAIAMQYYVGYRASAFDARAMHDLGNAAIAQEAYYATTFSYASFEATGPTTLDVPGMVVSSTITLKGEANGDTFSVRATSSNGTGKTFHYDSLTDTIRAD